MRTLAQSARLDKQEVDRLRAEGQSYRAIAERLGSNYSAVYRLHQQPAETALEPIEVHAEPVSAEPVQSSAWTDHEQRLQVLEAYIATLQRQSVQTSAYSAVQAVQSWEDPEDAKPERWNLWLPRGLKRRLETAAKVAGIAPSQLVQRLLLASLNGGEQ